MLRFMQDEENFEVVPGTEFVIARTATRDNKSDYYVNDRKSSFSEVTTLLKGKGIDLDNNRFLILQGEVEQISMMKPKGQNEHETGLLEYLEDIIGTDKYIQMLEEGSKRLEELSEKRQTVLQRVKIAERERDSLESDKSAAEAYLSKELECLQAKNMLAQVQTNKAQKAVSQTKEKIDELEEKIAEEKEKCKDFAVAMEQEEARYNTAVEEHQKIEQELESATGEFKEFERKDIKYREDMKHLKAKLKKIEDKLLKDAAKLQNSEIESKEIENAVPHMTERVEKLQSELGPAEEKLEKLLDSIKGEVEELHVKMRGARAELAPWEKKITEVQSKLDIATSERDMLQKGHEDAKKRYENAKIELKESKIESEVKFKQAKEIESQLDKLKNKLDQALAKEQVAAENVKKLEISTREVRGRAENRRADASQRASASAVVSALLDAKSSGSIPGIYGRLGDLGAIDAEYDIAVSTACPALDYIVVDTTSTAQKCVEFLRKKQLGVTTFLILEKQAHLMKSLQEKVSPPEGCPRLIDLVKCQDKGLAVAFYYAMRDTLVARDLDQASRIAYSGDKRWRRVVTMKGEMINENGTMSGGGAKPRGGRLRLGNAAPNEGTKDAIAELKTAEKELQTAVQDLQNARAALDDAQAEVKAAQLAVQDVETEVPKLLMEAQAAKDRAGDLEASMPELEEAGRAISPEDQSRLEYLSTEIRAHKDELTSLRHKSESLMKQVQKLEESIENAGGEKVKRQKDLVSRIQNEITEAEGEVTKKGVQAKTAIKQAEKIKKEIEKLSDEKEKLGKQLEATVADFKSLEDAAFKVLEIVQATQAVLTQKQEELSAARAAFEQRQKELSSIRQGEVDIGAALDEEKTKMKELKTKLDYWINKAKSYTAALEERTGESPAAASEEEIKNASSNELQCRIDLLKEEMSQMNINIEAIEAWRKADTEYCNRVTELEAASAERDSVRKEHEELQRRRLDEFMAGFNTISLKLKEMYQMITLGGDAELELVDTLDPFSEGILFSVRPPKKSWKNIANLSGGEKTLSSLSLVFALHHYKPTPLYVMDEIDAALDFKNVSIVGHYIKDRTKDAQFVIISLRNQCFELADRLVGVYKTDNATKTVAINPGQFCVGSKTVSMTKNSDISEENADWIQKNKEAPPVTAQ